MRNLKILVIGLASFAYSVSIAQVKIGANLSTLDSSAILEVESTTRGLLPPRLTTAQRDSISKPSSGLLIYNTTKNCMEIFTGSGWYNECEASISAQGGGNASSGGTAVISAWSSTIGCSVGAGTNNSPAGVRQGGVNQTMVQGISVNGVATVTLVANVTTVGTYNVFTNSVNGVSFFATGTFASTGNQTVTFAAMGTPILPGNYKWAIIRTPTIDVYGSVITASAPLGSYYNAHFNGCDSANFTLHSNSQPFTAATYSGGDKFSNNTSCQNKPISAQGCGGISSIRGNSGRSYNTILINGQCWLQANLNDTPSVFSNYTRLSWTTGNPGDQGYWGYYHTDTLNGSAGWRATEPGANEGYLYQWCAAMDATISERSRGLCPAGFHIPSDCEWMYLEHGLGMSITEQLATNRARANSTDREGIIAYKLMGAGTGHTNASGFTALLPGFREHSSGQFQARPSQSQFWSSSASSATNVIRRGVSTGTRGVFYNDALKATAIPTRCLKD